MRLSPSFILVGGARGYSFIIYRHFVLHQTSNMIGIHSDLNIIHNSPPHSVNIHKNLKILQMDEEN